MQNPNKMLVVAELCKLSSLLQLHKIKMKKMAVELPVTSFHQKKSRARGYKLRRGAVAGQDDWSSLCSLQDYAGNARLSFEPPPGVLGLNPKHVQGCLLNIKHG